MNKFLLFLLIFLNCAFCSAEIVKDDIADALPRNVKDPLIYDNYNFEAIKKVPITLKIIDPIETEADLYEGQCVNFKIAKDVLYNNKTIIRRGEIIPAKVAVIITPGMNGIPASIIFNDFELKGLSKNQVTDSYEITGQNRSPLVFPLKWALTILPPTGTLTNFIMGGHAKMNTKKIITLYYYPEWK